MKIYNAAADVAAKVQERRVVLGASAMTSHDKELRLAMLQIAITEKLAKFLDESIIEVNRCSNEKEIREIETLRESLMDSIDVDDIRRPVLAC